MQNISKLFMSLSDPSWLLDLVFGKERQGAVKSNRVVLFGAGGLGQEICTAFNTSGLTPACFCDNDASKAGNSYCGLPVISFDELNKSHRNSFIVIATQKHLSAVTSQLLGNNFQADRVFCKESDPYTDIVFSYAMFHTQAISLLSKIKHHEFMAATEINYRKVISRLKSKSKIRVAFFVSFDSVWKYDDVYRIMEKEDRFEPIIVICPCYNFGDTSRRHMKDAFDFFSLKNYKVINTFNEKTGAWMDVKKEINPDIVFFTNPYVNTNKDQYYITNYLDCLTGYIPYAITVSNVPYQNDDNQYFHSYLWKAFYETSKHKELAVMYAQNKGSNVAVTGYPGTDIFIDKTYRPLDVWKIKTSKLKRIIWAPHHTIHTFDDDNILRYSNFLTYHQLFLDLAETYSDKLQFAFKPHPLLKERLYRDATWGKERTDKYYSKWKNFSNGQLEESDYVDLFLTSDAMIHDSGSFMTEYLYLDKPVLFTVRDKDIKNRFNNFGKMVFEQLYHANNEREIFSFLEDVVLKGNDPKRKMRTKFYNDYLRPPNNKSASENIIDIIKMELE